MGPRHTFSILPLLRNNRLNKDGEAAVYLRITVDGKRAEVSTRVSVHKDKWNSSKGIQKSNSEEARVNNNSIKGFEVRVRAIYQNLLEKGKVITAEIIKNILVGVEEKQKTLYALFQATLLEMKSKEGNGYASGTLKNWDVTKRHLKEFITKHYHVSDIPLKEIDHRFIKDFELYAKTNWKCRSNAAIKHIERIRVVIKVAVANNWLDKDPLLSYKSVKEKTHRIFLTGEELLRMEEKNFMHARLDRVRDIFVFACYTGLAYVDVEKVIKDNLVTGIDGQKWLYTYRTKTGSKSNIPLLPKALSILEKYKRDPISINKEKLLPTISNVKTNEYLKEVADLCEIKKNLTFHMARHTFATTIALTNGVPIETVSNILGHTSLRTTQIYAKVVETKVSRDMLALRDKMLDQQTKSEESKSKSITKGV